MRIQQGSDRICVVTKETTYKIAKTDPLRSGIEVVKIALKDGPVKGARRIAKNMEHSVQSFPPRRHLLKGVDANRSEQQLSQDYPDQIIQTATYFGGILNVQPTVQTLADVSPGDIKQVFDEEMGIDDPARDLNPVGHTLESGGNFGISEGRVIFLDAGSESLGRALDEYSEQVSRALGRIAKSA